MPEKKNREDARGIFYTSQVLLLIDAAKREKDTHRSPSGSGNGEASGGGGGRREQGGLFRDRVAHSDARTASIMKAGKRGRHDIAGHSTTPSGKEGRV